jgi:hypothetical protein
MHLFPEWQRLNDWREADRRNTGEGLEREI